MEFHCWFQLPNQTNMNLWRENRIDALARIFTHKPMNKNKQVCVYHIIVAFKVLVLRYYYIMICQTAIVPSQLLQYLLHSQFMCSASINARFIRSVQATRFFRGIITIKQKTKQLDKNTGFRLAVQPAHTNTHKLYKINSKCTILTFDSVKANQCVSMCRFEK